MYLQPYVLQGNAITVELPVTEQTPHTIQMILLDKSRHPTGMLRYAELSHRAFQRSFASVKVSYARPVLNLPRRMVTTRTDTGVKHHPKVTKQGTPGTGKPAMALCKKKAAKPDAIAE